MPSFKDSYVVKKCGDEYELHYCGQLHRKLGKGKDALLEKIRAEGKAQILTFQFQHRKTKKQKSSKVWRKGAPIWCLKVVIEWKSVLKAAIESACAESLILRLVSAFGGWWFHERMGLGGGAGSG